MKTKTFYFFVIVFFIIANLFLFAKKTEALYGGLGTGGLCLTNTGWGNCDDDDDGGGGGGGVRNVCSPVCKADEVCNAQKVCVPRFICTPKCKDNEVCNAEKKCEPNKNCPDIIRASVGPSVVRPGDLVTVKCNYGKRMDCLTVVGAGLKNCRYSRYEGTDNIFTCEASANAGFYNDAKCVTSTGTEGRCCKGDDKIGNMNIIGSEVEYNQDVVLPFGSYTFSSTVFSVIAKGKGNKVSIICNSPTCTTGVKQNGVVESITFPQGTDFASQSKKITLKGTGDDRHYQIQISVDKGGEAYFDSVSLKDSKEREFVQNGDFRLTTQSTVTTKQPVSWGEGDNKVGYYYGSLAAEEVTGGVGGGVGVGGGGGIEPWPIPTTGKPTSISLTMKIKLQGINKKPKDADPISVTVRLAGTTGIQASGSAVVTPFAPVTKIIAFTVDDAGIWMGKGDFDNIPTGGGYKIYIKAPMHIQKKICDSSPSESKGGIYHCGEGKIVLSKGNNTLDFSKIIQLAGDLPEAGGKQNGIVDAYDTTFVRTNLGSSDAGKLKIGDLNLDGIIDTQDYSMVLQSLSIKYDEE